jgi:DNA-binding response OmpR family regulator
MEGQRLLVVEDDRATCFLLAALFGRLGVEVRTAHTVADGLALLAERPDYLILDLALPDGDGAEVLERVRADGLPTRVAVTTGWTDPEAVEGLRPDVVLLKPVGPDELMRGLGLAG